MSFKEVLFKGKHSLFYKFLNDIVNITQAYIV